jgi:hypothetical protein
MLLANFLLLALFTVPWEVPEAPWESRRTFSPNSRRGREVPSPMVEVPWWESHGTCHTLVIQ